VSGNPQTPPEGLDGATPHREPLGRIGAERRVPAKLPAPQPGRRVRRISGLGCAALFLTGILLGALGGLLFLGRWGPRRPPSRAPGPAPPPTAVPSSLVALPPVPSLVFSLAKVRPAETPDVLDAGRPEVHCFFDVPDRPRTAKVAILWVTGDRPPVDSQAQIVKTPSNHLSGEAVLKPPLGKKLFAEGIYEVEVLVDGERALDGSFAMLKGGAGLLQAPKGMERYRPEIKDLSVSTGTPPTQAKKPFVLPASPPKVLVRFRYAYALPGTAFTVYWLYEDGLIPQASTEINIQQDSGTAEAWFRPKPPGKLPAGKYGVIVSLSEGAPPLAKEDFWVGRMPEGPGRTAAGQ
jgi:hypothetical protein